MTINKKDPARKFQNFNDKIFGDYGEEKWKGEPGDSYEWNRFEKHAHGRRKHQRELSQVNTFLKTLPVASLILDTPCGMGRFTKSILSAEHIPVSVDINFDRIQETKNRFFESANVSQGDIFKLAFADKTFDAVLCFRLFHHLPDNLIFDALKEINRVSNVAFFTFYSKASLKYVKKSLRGKKLSGQYYTFEHIKSLAEEAGWEKIRHINKLDFLHNLHYVSLS